MRLFKKKKIVENIDRDLENGVATIKDHMAPSLVKELAPSELTGENMKANDYLVEMGAGTENARYYRSFTATMTTSNTFAGMFNQLYQGDFGEADADIVIHVEPKSTNVINKLGRLIAGLESDLENAKSTIEREKIIDSIMDIREQVRRLRRNVEKMFSVSIQVVVSSNSIDNLKKFSKTLIKRFAGQGVVLRPNDRKQLPALFCATPFDTDNVIKNTYRNMESSNIADMFPFGQGCINHNDGIVLGVDGYGNMVFFDAWHPELLNSHMVIFGRSGSGKSFSIKVITGRSALIGIKTAIIDPDRNQEYLDLVTAYGGSYFSLDPKSKDRINFFDVDISEDKDGNVFVDLEGAINGVQAIIYRMVEAISPRLLEDGLLKIKIREKIRELYANWGITEDVDSLYETETSSEDNQTFSFGRGKLKRMPTLSDFYKLIKQDPGLQNIAEALRIFTREGNDPTMSIFDCESTVDVKQQMIFAFSTANLEKTIMRPIGMFIATKWLKEKYGQQDRFQKKRIIIDESQEFLKHPELADSFEEMFRQLRRFNCSMVAVSQGFEVFMRVPQGLGILKNATIKLLLRQEAVDFEDVKGKFDLTEGEMNFLLNASEGTGILRVDNQSTVINILPTAKEFELYNTDPNIIAEMIKSKQKTGGELFAAG